MAEGESVDLFLLSCGVVFICMDDPLSLGFVPECSGDDMADFEVVMVDDAFVGVAGILSVASLGALSDATSSEGDSLSDDGVSIYSDTRTADVFPSCVEAEFDHVGGDRVLPSTVLPKPPDVPHALQFDSCAGAGVGRSRDAAADFVSFAISGHDGDGSECSNDNIKNFDPFGVDDKVWLMPELYAQSMEEHGGEPDAEPAINSVADPSTTVEEPDLGRYVHWSWQSKVTQTILWTALAAIAFAVFAAIVSQVACHIYGEVNYIGHVTQSCKRVPVTLNLSEEGGQDVRTSFKKASHLFSGGSTLRSTCSSTSPVGKPVVAAPHPMESRGTNRELHEIAASDTEYMPAEYYQVACHINGEGSESMLGSTVKQNVVGTSTSYCTQAVGTSTSYCAHAVGTSTSDCTQAVGTSTSHSTQAVGTSTSYRTQAMGTSTSYCTQAVGTSTSHCTQAVVTSTSPCTQAGETFTFH